MRRVLFVSYAGILGGAERVLLDCAGAVGGGSVLLCPAGPLADAARERGLPVLELPARPLALRGGWRTRAAAAAGLADHALRMRRACAGVDCDLVVAWGMRPAIGWLLGSRGWPAVVAHHDFLPAPTIGRLVRRAARRAEAVVVPSGAVADDLDPAGRLGERLVVVAPGVDLERFSDAGEPGGPPGEVLVLGALSEWKRPDLALEIVARARRSGLPGLRLRLVGAPVAASGGASRRLVEALTQRAREPDLAGAVELVGAVTDVRPALARATCLLHCAPREPFGLALVEALAAGRPVVAPDAAGPREIVDETCGRLYRPGDADAGAAALVELLTPAGEAARAGAAGRERAARLFTRARAQAAFVAALEGCGSGRGEAASPADRPLVGPSELTIVTVTHESAPELRVLLDSVQRLLPGASVVVVDCASTDGSADVGRGRAGVETVALDENVGFGRAANAGVRRARTAVVALLNPDVELVDDSLLALAAEALRADRLLAPRVLNGDGGVQDTAHPAPASAADLVRALVPPAIVPGRAGVALAPWRSRVPRPVGWAVGCALVARADVLRALGPFDESIFLYGEDLELGLRARRRGVATWLWPGAVVVHRRAHASARAFGGEPFERLARARHYAVVRALGERRAAVDDAVQMVTFWSRGLLQRALGRPAVRERRQLAAVRALRGR